MADLNKKQVNFELDEDEINMLEELLALEGAKRGRVTRSDYGGNLIREQHRKEFPSAWDGCYYKPRLAKLTA